jgi:hypothetical protein
MKHVDRIGKTDGVNSTKGIAVEIRNNFQNAAAAEPLKRLCRVGLVAALCLMECVADASTNFPGKPLTLLGSSR